MNKSLYKEMSNITNSGIKFSCKIKNRITINSVIIVMIGSLNVLQDVASFGKVQLIIGSTFKWSIY